MLDLTRVPSALFVCALESNLRRVGPPHKLRAHFLDAVRLRLGAECAFLAHGPRERSGLVVRGAAELFDEALVLAFLRRERPAVPADTLLVPLALHGRLVGVLGACRGDGEFDPAARRLLESLGDVLVAELERRGEEQQERVLTRIREKIVSELRPRDLAYQILDGLHQLVDYDHSSAFLTWDPAASAFRIEAEKIVWTKAKSAFVGSAVPAAPEQVEALRRGIALAHREGPEADALRRVLDYHKGEAIPPVSGLLSAPLFFGETFLGLLKIAAWKRPPFDARDLAVVERFLPAAAVAMRNARVNLSLERQAVEAEVKAGLVTLARAVAHDVNNAVGGILPLAQQMRQEVREGRLDPATLERDLGMIVDNARLCQRIFGNMLRAGGAGGGRPGDGPVDLTQTVRETLPFFQGRAARQGVAVALELAEGLPAVRCSRHDLQHVVLNLVQNSLDALEGGGRIVLAAAVDGEGTVELTVADDGPGIAPELLDRVQEPFFTTKSGGTGLGLSICRALAWQNGGSFQIASAPGQGTRVTVGLRAAEGIMGARP